MTCPESHGPCVVEHVCLCTHLCFRGAALLWLLPWGAFSVGGGRPTPRRKQQHVQWAGTLDWATASVMAAGQTVRPATPPSSLLPTVHYLWSEVGKGDWASPGICPPQWGLSCVDLTWVQYGELGSVLVYLGHISRGVGMQSPWPRGPWVGRAFPNSLSPVLPGLPRALPQRGPHSAVWQGALALAAVESREWWGCD